MPPGAGREHTAIVGQLRSRFKSRASGRALGRTVCSSLVRAGVALRPARMAQARPKGAATDFGVPAGASTRQEAYCRSHEDLHFAKEQGQ